MKIDTESLLLAVNEILVDRLDEQEYITSISVDGYDLIIIYNTGKRSTVNIPFKNIEPIKGEKGDPGPVGAKGDSGEIGPQGNKGEKGDPGPAGVKGDRGAKGEKGSQGDVGPAGLKGDPGEKGEQGLQGERGNGIVNIKIDQRGHLIITTDDKVYDLGIIKGKIIYGGGGGEGSNIEEFAYTNSLPMPFAVGGFPQGTIFDNMNLKDLWTGLLYGVANPIFTSFIIQDIDTILEVGDTIPVGDYTTTWEIVNDALLKPDSIDIKFINDDLLLADNLPNVVPYNLRVPQLSFNSPIILTFRIEATSTTNDIISRNFVVRFMDRIYIGESELTVLTENDVKGLRFTTLKENINGQYNLLEGGYKWICYPESMGTRDKFYDVDTKFQVAMNDLEIVTITNAFGVDQNYYCYRTFNKLGGALKIEVS